MSIRALSAIDVVAQPDPPTYRRTGGDDLVTLRWRLAAEVAHLHRAELEVVASTIEDLKSKRPPKAGRVLQFRS